MNEGVLALDANGDVLRANPAACGIFGLNGELVGLPTEAVDRRPEFLALARRALAGETVPPTELRRGDRQLVITGQPLQAGGAVIFCLDVSEMRRLEDVRRDFVANASHELKTPLTVLRGYLETLEDENLPAALRKQFLETLKANADRLQRVVEDLLDLSRIESGGWRVEPVALSLATVARESWTEFAERADAGEVEFHCDVNPEILRVAADPAALRQVFCNLYDNALRYTPPGGAVTVTAGCVGEAVRVEVRDTGSGISAAHLSRIFERFYRADSGRARIEGGTGLGLAIVRHFVERHGGEVDAASELGRGTTIGFTLPPVEEDVGSLQAAPPTPDDAVPLRRQML
ncbi:MAG: ATP-binding protein, partial [Longimicrobiaceae bacterium]